MDETSQAETTPKTSQWELSRLFRASDVTVGPRNSAGEHENGVDFVASGDGMERRVNAKPGMGGFNMRPLNYNGRLGHKVTDEDDVSGAFYLHADGELGPVEIQDDGVVRSDEAVVILDQKEQAAELIKKLLEKSLESREYTGTSNGGN